MFLGNVEYECALQPIDFAKLAEAFGITGFRAGTPEDVGAALDATLRAPGAALLEATVDPNEPLLPAKRIPKYAENLDKALALGTAGAADIRAALERDPARTMLT